MEPSDAQIVRRVLAGDANAFSVLVERYYDHYARFAQHLVGNREDAEEVLQDTFLRAFRALHRYEERERFGAWLMRILVNQARTLTAKGKRRERLFIEGAVDWQPATATQPAERDELREEFGRALSLLRPDQREAFLLYHVEGVSYDEMATITGLGVSALKMRVKRACDRLRELLDEVKHV